MSAPTIDWSKYEATGKSGAASSSSAPQIDWSKYEDTSTPQAAPEGAVSRFMHGAGQPTSRAELDDLTKNLPQRIGQAVAANVKKGSQDLSEAISNVRAGQPFLANAGKAVLGVGEMAYSPLPLVSAGEAFHEKNYAGGLGGVAATAAALGAGNLSEPTPPSMAARAKALDALIPSKPGVNTAESIATPETVNALRESGARLGVKDAHLTEGNATATLRNVVAKAQIEHNALFDRYLNSETRKVPISDLSPAIQAARTELTPALEAVDPSAVRQIIRLTDRLEEGQFTLGDLDDMRKLGDGKLKQAYQQTAAGTNAYPTSVIDALRKATDVVRGIEYGKLEALHNLPPDSLRALKLQQGQLIQLDPMARQVDAEISKLRSQEAVKSTKRLAGEQISRVGTAVTAATDVRKAGALAAEPANRIAESTRLIKQVLGGLDKPKPLGYNLPAPTPITLRSSMPQPLVTPYNARAAAQAASPNFGGPQATSGAAPRYGNTPAFPQYLQSSTPLFTEADVMEAAKSGRITPAQANARLKALGRSRDVNRLKQ